MIPAHTLSLTLTDPLGTPITVQAANLGDLRALQRHYGAQGMRPHSRPVPGGLQLPLASHDTFDWSLIGARPWVTPEGEAVVFCAGHVYKQRVLDEVETRKMRLPPAIKYSRGAKGTDPEELREKGDAEFQYVTLVMFRGGGRAHPDFALPGGARQRLAVAQPEAAD
ncbi:single-stranded DNA-binding protein [Deinococcus frigens]|uniref:single-stranded DNA-binding protein n=1 Tax=Deinococcus frigens TaxID=249403 RepID=UPI0009FD6C28|nr:single-stranded DNA-binding protein [Deinococcus frigens]